MNTEKDIFKLLNKISKNELLFPLERLTLIELFRNDYILRREIIKAANIKTRNAHHSKLYVRGVIEISNKCKNKCKYCSMSSENKTLGRYSIPIDEIKEIIYSWANKGIKVFHLSSGEQDCYSFEDMLDLLKFIQKLSARAIIVTGGKTNNELQGMISTCPNLTLIEKFETANPWLYSEYNDKSISLEHRISQLMAARSLGYQIGTGNIVGLPFQTHGSLIDDLQLLAKIKPDQASTSNYVRSGESVYSAFSKNPHAIEDTILFIALMRIILDSSTLIPTNSSLGNTGKELALQSGANLISINLTPPPYLNNYLIYDQTSRCNTALYDLRALAFRNNLDLEFNF